MEKETLTVFRFSDRCRGEKYLVLGNDDLYVIMYNDDIWKLYMITYLNILMIYSR